MTESTHTDSGKMSEGASLDYDYQDGDGMACTRPAPCLRCPAPCNRAIELYKSAAGFTLMPFVKPPPSRLARLRTGIIARLSGREV